MFASGQLARKPGSGGLAPVDRRGGKPRSAPSVVEVIVTVVRDGAAGGTARDPSEEAGSGAMGVMPGGGGGTLPARCPSNGGAETASGANGWPDGAGGAEVCVSDQLGGVTPGPGGA